MLAIGWFVPVTLIGVFTIVAGIVALRWRFQRALQREWESFVAPAPAGTFDPAMLHGLPEPARRYLSRAIAPGTPLYGGAVFHMEGTFSGDGRKWMPMTAAERIVPRRGFVFLASMGGVVTGGDRCRVADDGRSATGGVDFRLGGVLPVAQESGTDAGRSSLGRLVAEWTWLPVALLPGNGVEWIESDESDVARVCVAFGGETTTMDLTLDADGALTGLALQRWGDPDKTGTHCWHPFGGTMSGTFEAGGLRVPEKLEAGWHMGTDRFVPFFRVTITGLTPLE